MYTTAPNIEYTAQQNKHVCLFFQGKNSLIYYHSYLYFLKQNHGMDAGVH